MKKQIILAATIALLLVACGGNKKPNDLLAYSSSTNDDYTYVTIEDKVFIPFTPVANTDRGDWIGIVDGDDNNRIYEYKDYSSDEWVISFYNSGEMDISMLMREESITDYPEGITSEYEWNNVSVDDSCNSEYPILVKVNDVIYKDTGYVSSALGCDTMDGKITSTVDSSKTPTENQQSNFGADYGYQLSSEGQLIVVIDDVRMIFRDLNSTNRDIPIEVANFTATIKEVRNDGSLLVTFKEMPDIFISLSDGDYLIDGASIENDFSEGDTVRIWFDGSVLESLPAIIPTVYKIEVL